MRDYRHKTVDGYITDGFHLAKIPVDVRMTSDKLGQSLSFTAGEIQIGIPLESVHDIIKVVGKAEEEQA